LGGLTGLLKSAVSSGKVGFCGDPMPRFTPLLACVVSLNVMAAGSMDLIKSTPCLYEWRFWKVDRKFGEPFKIPEGFTAEQCANAEKVDEQVRELQEREEAEHAKLLAKQQAEQERKALAFAKRPGARIGMTARDVVNRTNWGEPLYKNTTITARGKREQWVYEDRQYLYFENGRLTAIQTTD